MIGPDIIRREKVATGMYYWRHASASKQPRQNYHGKRTGAQTGPNLSINAPHLEDLQREKVIKK